MLWQWESMKRYKPTKHLLQRRQEDPAGHRYSAGQAADIHLPENLIGTRGSYSVYRGEIDGKGVNLVLDKPTATASVYPVVSIHRKDMATKL
jgi:hypothetical protein